MHSVLLDYVDVPGKHTGQHIATYVQAIIDRYGLQKKIIGIVTDNAKANDVAIQELIRAMKLDDTTYPSAEDVHIRCFGHILNICCQGKNLIEKNLGNALKIIV